MTGGGRGGGDTQEWATGQSRTQAIAKVVVLIMLKVLLVLEYLVGSLFEKNRKINMLPSGTHLREELWDV